MTEMQINILMMSIWVIMFVIALIAEISTAQLVSVWFCIGAVAALAVTFIPGTPFWADILVFLGVSIIALLVTRPLVNRALRRRTSRTNIDDIIEKKGKLTKSIEPFENGEVKIDGVLWTALSAKEGESIEEGAVVEVVAIKGNKLFVKRAS
jgi:membrane protein implicated in regulation of membrane protease activity